MVAARSLPPVPAPVPAAAPLAKPDIPLKADALVHGFEFEKGKYVTFEREEVEGIAPRSSSDMQIVEFVRMNEVDPIYLESSYYVVADKGGEKPYALLLTALEKTGYAAVAEFVMHRRDQTVILRAGKGTGLIAHTLFYEDEIRRENAAPEKVGPVPDRELDLAVKLVEALAAEFDPTKFKDKYRERMTAAIQAKVAAGAVTSPAPVATHTAAGPVVDIMAALRESLQAAKKPVVREASRKLRSAK